MITFDFFDIYRQSRLNGLLFVRWNFPRISVEFSELNPMTVATNFRSFSSQPTSHCSMNFYQENCYLIRLFFLRWQRFSAEWTQINKLIIDGTSKNMKSLSRLVPESEAPGMQKKTLSANFSATQSCIGMLSGNYHTNAYLGVNRLYSNEQDHDDSCHDRQAAQSTGAAMPHRHKIWWLFFIAENSSQLFFSHYFPLFLSSNFLSRGQ